MFSATGNPESKNSTFDDQSNGGTGEQFSELDRHRLWRPYCQMKTAPPAMRVVEAEGSWLVLEDGTRLIDGISSWWTACHGHRHPHIVDAIVKQAGILPHVMMGGIENPQARRLAERLAEWMPGDLNHVFLVDSGSVAVEVAMKIAVQYFLNKGISGRNRFLSLKHAYHGDTSGAMSICDPDDSMHRHFRGFLLEQFPQELPVDEEGWTAFGNFVASVASRCAGIVVEPLVQGAAGCRMYSADSLRRLFEISREHDLLFIADEIATGFFRTGKLLACQWADVVPDILCIGKSLTGGTVSLAATIATRKVYRCFHSDDSRKALMHGPTYMGNPIACAAANASLDLFADGDYESRVTRLEMMARESLGPLSKLDGVADVRIKGAFWAIETTRHFDRAAIHPALLQMGVWLRPIENVLYAAPPFTISDSEFKTITSSITTLVNEHI